jgi:hypothetical protein
MADQLETKVVISQPVLRGSGQAGFLQEVAVVVIDGEEYRVLAPSAAKGDALGWVAHFTVRQLTDFSGETVIQNAFAVLAVNAVEEELKRRRRDENRAQGVNPDGRHFDAQICFNGHVLHSGGTPFEPSAHCTKCGAPCIDDCPDCKEPIHGQALNGPGFPYSRPDFCHGCGHPYPWMKNRLDTARALLKHADKLSADDQNELWDCLQYVVSNPRGELAPAKKKLTEVILEKGPPFLKEAVLELFAKIAVESMKG